MELNNSVRIPLYHEYWHGAPNNLLRFGSLGADIFTYKSGIQGIRLSNNVGELEILPFNGQQIWRAKFHGRELTMKSMFTEPRLETDFLSNFGGFLIHCGLSSMGAPGPTDHHPLHGELPNARYQESFLICGEDKHGEYIGLGGEYNFTQAFSNNYIFEPRILLYEGSSVFNIFISIRNLKQTPMEFMYLAHINFKPINYSRLCYSAKPTPEHVRVRSTIPSHILPQKGYREFIEELKLSPEKHHLLSPELLFNPEIVFFIDFLADKQGWAHSMQIHPDGTADYVSHKPKELPKGTRWICRTMDQDALGFEPGTAEPEGFTAEKKKGNINILEGGSVFETTIKIGLLLPEMVNNIEGIISSING